MKRKILGLLAAALLVGPITSQAIVVTVNGTSWNVTTASGTFDGLLSQLDDQPWWGSDPAAVEFATAVGGSLGFPNTFIVANDRGPVFAYVDLNGLFPFGIWRRSIGQLSSIQLTRDAEYTFAFASRAVPAPEPGTLALLGLGLAGLGLSRRRKAA